MPSLMPYEKQHQNYSKDVKRDQKRSIKKMAWYLKINTKSMRTIVKTVFKLSPLKLGKNQHFTVLK